MTPASNPNGSTSLYVVAILFIIAAATALFLFYQNTNNAQQISSLGSQLSTLNGKYNSTLNNSVVRINRTMSYDIALPAATQVNYTSYGSYYNTTIANYKKS